jgi:hypothetical protein
MSTIKSRVKTMLKNLYNFSLYGGGIELRPYQTEPADAIEASVVGDLGLTVVVMISRQAGKDEFLCHLKIRLLKLFSHRDVEIVEFNPTYKPQTIRAILRLENRLQSNVLTRGGWKKRSDFMRMIGQARVSFLSGDGQANVVGATASLLLIINEAQDIAPMIYDKKAAPMVASTNATRVIVGTAWTSQTLLARELRAARQAEAADGIRRVFVYDADEVRKHNPAYGKFVDGEIARLGRHHPLVETQYFNTEIDAQAGMFNATRRALMTGDQPAQDKPTAGHVYAFCIDIAGQDEAAFGDVDAELLNNPGRDAVALTIYDVDLSSLATLQAPTYRAVYRETWTGLNHLVIFGKLAAFGATWKPLWWVIDATGVGEGLWAMLDKAFPTKVIPVKYSASVKSEIGYRYLAIIETGRMRDCCPTPTIDKQYTACVSEILTGPAKTMRWGVPEGARDEDGALIHDDIVMADSLVSELDLLEWYAHLPTALIQGEDPLTNMDRNF